MLLRKILNLFSLIRACFWLIYFGFPSKSLNVVMVTGTDGKTTTCNFIYQFFKNSGNKVGIISTVLTASHTKTYETGFHTTTPSAYFINKLLYEMKNEGCKYVVIETTSHALDQYRVLGINSKVSVVTNVTSEHLDYHKTFSNYLKTKARVVKQSDFLVLNETDKSTDYLIEECVMKNKPYLLFNPSQVENFIDLTFKNKFPGTYNLENLSAATKVIEVLKIDISNLKELIQKLEPCVGRYEIVCKKPFEVIVDFAHTPNALERLLSGKELRERKLILVFGSAGGRDKLKRPEMGFVVSKYAKYAVITAEDPRNEKVEDICREIEEGFKRNSKTSEKDYFIVYDRKEAIKFALKNLAKEGDLVFITGKGHEKSMAIKGKELPWSDIEVVKELL